MTLVEELQKCLDASPFPLVSVPRPLLEAAVQKLGDMPVSAKAWYEAIREIKECERCGEAVSPPKGWKRCVCPPAPCARCQHINCVCPEKR